MIREIKLTFSLIICTFERADSLKRLLESVEIQSLYPDEIIIVDGSIGSQTKEILRKRNFSNLQYYQVGVKDRGLTRQRNFGIKQSGKVDIICFLDDDIVLEQDYFKELIITYSEKPDATAVGGWIKDEVDWRKVSDTYIPSDDEFVIDGYVRKLGKRNFLRKRLGLLSDKPPGFMPEFSNGLSTGFLPPSGKIYLVEYFMGGVSSFRKRLFSDINFSQYFEGYGLYEDMDFTLRASKIGQLYVNTEARVDHLHDQSGRPNWFKYGKMVIRNGWFVWRVKFSNPSTSAKLKWYGIAFLLTLVRFSNVFSTPHKKEAFYESLGRIVGCWSLIIKRPGTSEKVF